MVQVPGAVDSGMIASEVEVTSISIPINDPGVFPKNNASHLANRISVFDVACGALRKTDVSCSPTTMCVVSGNAIVTIMNTEMETDDRMMEEVEELRKIFRNFGLSANTTPLTPGFVPGPRVNAYCSRITCRESYLAQHSIEKEHKILFDHTKVINKSSHYWDRTIKEAIEIKLERNNFNRDSGLQLSQAWTPALDQLRPSYNQGHEDHGPRTATDSNRRNWARRPPNFTQESREGRSLRGMTIPGPGLADPPTNPVSPETA
ncbi:hypothetical protein ANN_21465 [Periplaneta americana]|uniref:C2H2-type domain-containing protein n=1 Tax=Periplaneta americana TaxID=6978 RepID=A0ABQ8SG84_PERAM|nr:hypothetical protein ANN_21465 [Periplaneta americana]